MDIDLSKCKKGQKLLSSHGEILTYIEPCPEQDYYDHLVRYANGSKGTRTNDGFVFRNKRDPKTDHDIVEIVDD